VQHAYAAGERGVPANFLSKYSPSWEGVRGWWTRVDGAGTIVALKKALPTLSEQEERREKLTD
jgi:hypothetical protein